MNLLPEMYGFERSFEKRWCKVVETLCINPKNGGALIFDVEDLNIPLADISRVKIPSEMDAYLFTCLDC